MTLINIINAVPPFLNAHVGVMIMLSWVILGVGIIQSAIMMAQLPAAWLELKNHSQAEDTESPWQLLVSDAVMPITILVPAKNEEASIVQSVRSMLALKYPDFEVIVINDGSKDGTLTKLIEAFELQPIVRAHERCLPHAVVNKIYGSSLHPRLVVLDKENGGSKSNASNAGISYSRHPLFCVVDADSMLENEALLRAVRPFMEDPKRMVVVGGTIRVINGSEVKDGHIHTMRLPRHLLPLIQTVEYIRSFLMARLALSRWQVLTIIPGAFGIFRRSVVIEAGGYSHGTVGEDMELVIKIHRLMISQKRDYAMRFVPEPVCWTEAPETLKTLSRQRTRWERGSLECFFKHIDMFLNPAFGRIGMIGFPLILITDIMGPILEVLGYILVPLLYIAGVLSVPFLLAYIAVTFTFGIFVSLGSLILEEMELRRVPRVIDLCVLALISVIENFGYRQLNNIWRVIGWGQFLAGKRKWGEMKRKGFRPASVKKERLPKSRFA